MAYWFICLFPAKLYIIVTSFSELSWACSEHVCACAIQRHSVSTQVGLGPGG